MSEYFSTPGMDSVSPREWLLPFGARLVTFCAKKAYFCHISWRKKGILLPFDARVVIFWRKKGIL